MCGELFLLFKCHIPAERHHYFNMYPTNTDPEIQEQILKSFADPGGSVTFATIAFWLGVDIKGLHNVIMFGAPTDIDDNVQLSGEWQNWLGW